MKSLTPWVSLAVAIIAALFIFLGPGDHATKLMLAIGYATLVLVFLFGLVVLVEMVTGKIDLSKLIGEHDGGASMSRFQLLIFTFVIAFSFFLIVAHLQRFPDVPGNVLALLGISGSTYAVSKGIQAGAPNMPKK
jgi:hypothetical protein